MQSKLIVFTAILALALADIGKKEEHSKSIESKKDKRGLLGLGYGFDHSLDLGLSLPSSYSSYSSYPHISHGISTVITKEVAVPVPHPIVVPVEKHVAVPVKVPYAVPVDRPYPVHVPKPYPVEVTKHVAVPVDRPYPVPYAVKVPQPYPVPVVKHVAVSHPVVVEKYSSFGGHGTYAHGYSSW